MDDAAARIADNIQAASIYSQRPHGFGPGAQHHLDGLDGVDSDTASISTDVVNPERAVREHRLGRPQLPPIPDLRFQQSYLASISKASSWQHVAWITLRDQVRIQAYGSHRLETYADLMPCWFRCYYLFYKALLSHLRWLDGGTGPAELGLVGEQQA